MTQIKYTKKGKYFLPSGKKRIFNVVGKLSYYIIVLSKIGY